MKRDDSIYLRHILDAITKADGYWQGVDEATFQQNSLIQDGVIRQIEIVGEATGISPKIYAANIAKFPGKILRECGINSSTITSGLMLTKFG